jgi:hypothetical protein
MASSFKYSDILNKVQSEENQNFQSTADVDITVEPLQPVDFPMEDLEYQSTFTSAQQNITKLLSITQDSIGFVNTFANSPQVLINSDRIVLNTKRDYLMLFGAAGVAISSQNPVNVDSDASITLSGTEGIYLGVPNGGSDYDFANQKKPKTKGDPTENQPYEPIPLGIKLANLIEDLLVTIKNARIITPVGLGYLREDVQYELANLQARLPEILSSVVFVDGVSHESTDPPPATPAGITTAPTTAIGTTTQPGTVGSGNGDNAARLRKTLQSLGYSEKGNEIDNGGDINAEIEKIASAILRTIKQELPNLKLTVTGGNDKYHQNLSYNSRHKAGNGLDFVVQPRDNQTLDKVVNILQRYAAGNAPNFRFIDEYRHLTSAGTANHFHISWGAGSESQAELNKALALAKAGKITPITVT